MESSELQQFFYMCDPNRTLNLGDAGDRRYYIDFSPVRGSKSIESLKRTIARLSPHRPTCQLFTGHIGCGKSTELSLLQTELEKEGFFVIYFASTQDLDPADVDVTDILLAIARQVSESLEESRIALPMRGLRGFVKNVLDFLHTPLDVRWEGELLGGKVSASTDGGLEISLPVGIGKITAMTKNSQQQRSRLRNHLEAQTNGILDLINEEVIDAAIAVLKKQGKKGLVVIIDNLDRIQDRKIRTSGRLLPEYIFVDRGEQLRKLKCHLVYTIPLSLIFSNECEAMKNRLGGGIDPKVLPMVPIMDRYGMELAEGMKLLKQMVMTRAFPDRQAEERLQLIGEVFEVEETLDRLCRVSGGHVRNLMGMLYMCLQEEDPPISRPVLEGVIRRSRDRLAGAVDDEEWKILLKVVREQRVKGEAEYQLLLRSLFVFEYQDKEGNWFGINPLLAETEKYKKLMMVSRSAWD
ncbi:MAG: P-loop NTPase fold protein [Cyanobacteria bacterium P01_E01_bin.42]